MGINFGNMASATPATPTEVTTSSGAITLDLNKGALLDLTKREPGLNNIIVGAGWDKNDSVPEFDLDVSAFLLGENGKVRDARRIVFFNNMNVQGVSLSGDSRTGDGEGDDEKIKVTLSDVEADVKMIDFVINIFEAQQRRQTFGMVKNSYIRILNADKNEAEICRFRLREDYGSSTAVIAGRLKREGNDWVFNAIGEGKVVTSLNDIAAMYT